MKALLLLTLPLIVHSEQQQRSTGSAATTGTCSPATSGNITTLNFTCSGLTIAQQRILQNIPALLNKLLSTQNDNAAEIIAKLEACIAQGAPRSISDSQRQTMVATLTQLPFKPQIGIKTLNATAESSHFAQQLHDIFQSIPGFMVDPVQGNTVIGVPIDTSITAFVGDRSQISFPMQSLFREIGIQLILGRDQRFTPIQIMFVVGQKPVE